MLNLEKHINDLLYLYDCVIVPGLGGFVANKKSAELNEKTGVFSPPRREIGFNKSLSHNDGLLISHIANVEGVSFEDCNNKLAKHISILKYQLAKGEVIQIGSAGELKNDAMGNILFLPNQEESFSTDSFGLPTFHFNTLEQAKEQIDPTRHLVRRTLLAKSTRQIAASVTLILGLLFVSPEFGDQTQQNNFANMFPKMEQTNNSVSNEDLKEVKTNIVQEEIAQVIDNNNSTIEENISPIEIENSFYIIAGSFKDEQPASLFLNKLKRKGIGNAEILTASNRFRVSLEGFTNKEEASEALVSYRKKNGFSSAWLLKK